MNPYLIVILAVIAGGAGIAWWGWRSLGRSRRMRAWPTVEGEIVACEPSSAANDLLPDIVFAYRVDGRDYRRSFTFPEGTHPLPEFTRSYMERYPVGRRVSVHYDPADPAEATLEIGSQGEWMILALGLAMLAGGVLALLVA